MIAALISFVERPHCRSHAWTHGTRFANSPNLLERAENHTLRLPELTGYLSSDDKGSCADEAIEERSFVVAPESGCGVGVVSLPSSN